MPLHERKMIRDAVVAALTGQTDAGTSILTTRFGPVRESQLPLICVYTGSEQTDDTTADSSPRDLKRTLVVSIDVWVSAAPAAKLDDVFDALAMQIETAMDRDDTLDKNVFAAWPSASEFGVDVKGDRPMGCMHIEYTMEYHSDLRTQTQDTARPDFDTLGVTYQPNPEQAPVDEGDADYEHDLVDMRPG